MVTPTFVFSVTIVTMAVLAFGTTQTYLRFSSSGPDTGCGVGGCANPDASHTANGRTPGGPMAVGTPHAPARSPAPARSGASGDRAHPQSEVRISYRTIRAVPNGFVAEISITDDGSSAGAPWRLSFRYPGALITWMAGATWHMDGATVVIEPVQETPQLRAGTTVPVMFAATGQPGALSGCLFDGERCHLSD